MYLHTESAMRLGYGSSVAGVAVLAIMLLASCVEVPFETGSPPRSVESPATRVVPHLGQDTLPAAQAEHPQVDAEGQ